MRLSTKLLVSAIALSVIFPQVTAAHNLTGEADVSVHMTPEGYEPSGLTISLGETIAFENASSVDLWPASNIHPTHEIYSAFDPKRPLAPGEIWTFLFDREGRWLYHDHLNPKVTGAITVTAAESSSGKSDPLADGQPAAGEKQQGILSRFIESIAALVRRLLGSTDDMQADRAVAGQFPERSYDPAIRPDDETVFSDYDRLYSYVRSFGPEKTMQHLFELSARRGDCHDAAHRVGRFAFEIGGNEAFQKCAAECHSGCYHGATEMFFKVNGTAALNESLPTICSFSTNDFFSHQCVHGVGHGLMAWANYQLPEALANCDILESPINRESCYTGVFMENIVGTLGAGAAEGHYTNYLSDNPHFPCSIVDDKYTSACYFLQTSRMMTLFSGDFARIAAACLEVPERFQGHCFGSMGRDVGGVHRGDPAGAIAACKNAPAGSNRNDCLAGAVQDAFWDPAGQDEALSFCALLQDKGEKARCYNTVFERAPQVLNSAKALSDFCRKAESFYQLSCPARQ